MRASPLSTLVTAADVRFKCSPAFLAIWPETSTLFRSRPVAGAATFGRQAWLEMAAVLRVVPESDSESEED